MLVPITLADTLLRLAEADLYRPLWSTKILEEVRSAIVTVHPDMADGRAALRVARMDAAFEDACVTGWEALVDSIVLPDQNDRHVVAAAQRGRADVIVTQNLKDFPPDRLASLEIEVQHPDEFLLNQLDLAPDRTMQVLAEQVADARRPALTLEALLDRLARAGARRFAQEASRQLWRAR
ncbi:PIN domain-containing protein [Propionibacteriaceae bacterium G1746]